MITLKIKTPFYFKEDVLTIITAFFISVFFFWQFNFSRVECIILSCFIFLWALLEHIRKVYFSRVNNAISKWTTNYIKAYGLFVATILLFYMLIPIPFVNKKGIAAIAIGIPLLDILVYSAFISFKAFVGKTKEQVKYTLIAGTGTVAKIVEEQLYSRHVGSHQIKGFINCTNREACTVGQEKIVSNLKSIQQYLQENRVDEIVIALPIEHTKKIQNIISAADYHGIRVKYVFDYKHIFGRNCRLTRLGQIDAINVRQLPVEGLLASFSKTFFDRTFSALVLLFLSPLFIILSILIKLESPGPVFYCPMRIGRAGKPFRVFKFRSMRQNDPISGGTLSTEKDDARITKLGKIIRKYSLDELPQFLNVLLGDMSVVGPRPHRQFLNKQLQQCVYLYMVRHYVKPGITGWAQVNGWRGPTDTEQQKNERTRHDLWYIENWSFLLDLKIIFLTVFSSKVHSNAF
ncbi:exopolysaccharide biosynthesis polyprenyl glycosylphosphotransferase [Segetibacter aerophilus]|uniref:Undecaprenyl-phosphate glucose phosphotransferase n=1 Tax=Segetibacter aerophilus TaxID=670293 RepID=A0A512B890_9BACT|nr:exopolysaccharide biosynthesis polyprenyl glycosylphosphotransferase [Segetibacter aerophilus]GEO08182.1 undecaprenyl-phosphate glucose phosphotransferase [Segetibacter aerophilus]